MLFDNLSIGLDIATALSVIAAAIAFLWNSVLSNRKERNQRRKEIIKEQVFRVVDKLIDEQIYHMDIIHYQNQDNIKQHHPRH